MVDDRVLMGGNWRQFARVKPNQFHYKVLLEELQWNLSWYQFRETWFHSRFYHMASFILSCHRLAIFFCCSHFLTRSIHSFSRNHCLLNSFLYFSMENMPRFTDKLLVLSNQGQWRNTWREIKWQYWHEYRSPFRLPITRGKHYEEWRYNTLKNQR